MYKNEWFLSVFRAIIKWRDRIRKAERAAVTEEETKNENIAEEEEEDVEVSCVVLWYQLKLIKMRAKFVDLNNCAVLILSRAAANLC